MTNTIEFPVLMNDRADKLGRHSAFQGWYPEARLGSVVFRIAPAWPTNGSACDPIGIVFPDDSWELRSPGESALLAAGRNYAWVTQGFPSPERARAIQSPKGQAQRAPRKGKEPPKPKKCGWCDSVARTQPVGVRAASGKVVTLHACPTHLAEAFAQNNQEIPSCPH